MKRSCEGDLHPGITGFPICPLFVLVIIAILITAGCTGERVVVAHIVPVPDAADIAAPSYSYSFGQTTVSLTVPVNASVYAGAKAADKDVTIYGNVSEQEWVSQSYLSMIDDPAQDAFYSDLLGEFRKIRAGLSLDDDEYLELVAVFVQSIPYETTADNPPKYPVETFTDKSGDCDDKSLLLAGLLSREGYNVSLLSFLEESHMAVGVVCPGGDYRGTGYAYVETTNVTLAGIQPDDLAGGIVLKSGPLVIPVGSGTKSYGACGQTTYLYDMLTATHDRFESLSKEAETKQAELKAYAAKGNVKAYNQRVAAYNSLVARIKQNAEVHNYILSHQYDRKGTYSWVKSHSAGL